jgi:hypothetical protein
MSCEISIYARHETLDTPVSMLIKPLFARMVNNSLPTIEESPRSM